MAASDSGNVPPGLQPHYRRNYYAAFVHDPDGRRLKALCHVPE
ncbi:MAG: hypothetical protein ACJ8H8_32020 [Geminicoccaceae bacterium]